MHRNHYQSIYFAKWTTLISQKKKEKNLTRSFSCIYSYLLYVLQFATFSSHLHKHAHIEFPNVPARPTISPPNYLYAQSDIPNVFISPAKNEIKRDENIFFARPVSH